MTHLLHRGWHQIFGKRVITGCVTEKLWQFEAFIQPSYWSTSTVFGNTAIDKRNKEIFPKIEPAEYVAILLTKIPLHYSYTTRAYRKLCIYSTWSTDLTGPVEAFLVSLKSHRSEKRVEQNPIGFMLQ